MDQPNTPATFVASSAEVPKKKFPFVVLGIMLVILLVVGLGVITYFAAYTEVKIPLVGTELRKNLTVLTYKIPLLPKTPRQILTVASDTDKALTSYTADFSFSAKVGGAALSAGSFDLEFKGPLDFSDPKNPIFDIEASTHINMFNTNISLSGKARGLGKTVYFRIDEFPAETIDSFMTSLFGIGMSYSSYNSPSFDKLSSDQIAENLKPVMVNWISYDTGGLDTQARKALEENTQNQSIIDSVRKKIQGILLDRSVMPEIKLMGVEKMSGVDTYHLQVSPSKDTLKRVLTELISGGDADNSYSESTIEGFISASDAVVIDAWFGKNDSVVRKVSAQALLNTGALMGGMNSVTSPTAIMGTLGAGNINLSLVLGLTDIGKKADISVPSPVVGFDEYGKMFTDAMVSPEQKAWNEKSEKYRVDLTAISNGLLKYYIDNGNYPDSLSQAFGDQYVDYQYRITKSGAGYVVFVETGDGGAYYGITSTYTYPRNLTATDFN